MTTAGPGQGVRIWQEEANLRLDEVRRLSKLVSDLTERVQRQEALLSAPEIHDFVRGVTLEAAHQRQRWGSEHDGEKTSADWFWLVGHLAGKALHARVAGDTDKALHHTISASAALCNWHAAILGKTDMRPGIVSPTDAVQVPGSTPTDPVQVYVHGCPGGLGVVLLDGDQSVEIGESLRHDATATADIRAVQRALLELDPARKAVVWTPVDVLRQGWKINTGLIAEVKKLCAARPRARLVHSLDENGGQVEDAMFQWAKRLAQRAAAQQSDWYIRRLFGPGSSERAGLVSAGQIFAHMRGEVVKIGGCVRFTEPVVGTGEDRVIELVVPAGIRLALVHELLQRSLEPELSRNETRRLWTAIEPFLTRNDIEVVENRIQLLFPIVGRGFGVASGTNVRAYVDCAQSNTSTSIGVVVIDGNRCLEIGKNLGRISLSRAALLAVQEVLDEVEPDRRLRRLCEGVEQQRARLVWTHSSSESCSVGT